MNLDEQTRERIDAMVGKSRVVLFMKGTRDMPQCGFSAATIGILDGLGADYTTFNVLEDPDVREGIKGYSNWPTIPQLYIEREFVGGCDIVKQMYNTGALHEMLGREAPDRTAPEITISDEAADLMRAALSEQPGLGVHLQIDAQWQHAFNLGRAEGHEVRAEANGIEILMDVGTAQRARGLVIGMAESVQGRGFSLENPNAPPPVNELEPAGLARMLESKAPLELLDVRPSVEREKASLPGARALDDAGLAHLADLPRDTTLVFFCHHGQRSQAAAEHFRMQGFVDVHNLAGGIEAWSRDVDPSVPRY